LVDLLGVIWLIRRRKQCSVVNDSSQSPQEDH